VSVRALASSRGLFLCLHDEYTLNKTLSVENGSNEPSKFLTETEAFKSGFSLVVKIALHTEHSLLLQTENFILDDLEFETLVEPPQYIHTMSIY